MNKTKLSLILPLYLIFFSKTTIPALAENYTYKLYSPKTRESFSTEMITINTGDTYSIGLAKALTICKIKTVGPKGKGLLGGECSNINNHQTYYWIEYEPDTFNSEVMDIIEQKKAQGKNLDDSSYHVLSSFKDQEQTSNPPYWNAYMSRLQHKIKMNWDPKKENNSSKVVVLMKIAKDGRLLSCKIYKSSGSYHIDNAAINAVHLSAPFEPLPYEYKGSSIDVQFSFDYNVIQQSPKQSSPQIQNKKQDNKKNIKQQVYSSYAERNKYASEKIVAIYDKNSPAYGYQYVLYTPVGKYVGHHKIMKPSLNGYGLEGIPDGGEGSKTPCFRTLREAKHYYYPEWY